MTCPTSRRTCYRRAWTNSNSHARSRSRRINCATNLHYGRRRDNVPAPPSLSASTQAEVLTYPASHVIALIENSTRKKLVRATSCANLVRHLVRAFFRSIKDKKRHQQSDSSYQYESILPVPLLTLFKPAKNCPLRRTNAIATAICTCDCDGALIHFRDDLLVRPWA